MNLQTASPPDTRQRLLDAAGPIFAAKGFRATTVREICDAAAANVAAVNYHFRDKEGLYADVLLLAHQQAVEKYPSDLGVQPGAPPDVRLGAFVRSLLHIVLDKYPEASLGKIMSREIAEPTSALDALVERQIRPRALLLASIVAEITGRPPRDDAVRLAANSIVAQCLFYFHCRPIVDRLYPELMQARGAIERLAEHITSFSLEARSGA